MGVVAMPMPSPPQRSWPIGLLMLLAVAGVLGARGRLDVAIPLGLTGLGLEPVVGIVPIDVGAGVLLGPTDSLPERFLSRGDTVARGELRVATGQHRLDLVVEAA